MTVTRVGNTIPDHVYVTRSLDKFIFESFRKENLSEIGRNVNVFVESV